MPPSDARQCALSTTPAWCSTLGLLGNFHGLAFRAPSSSNVRICRVGPGNFTPLTDPDVSLSISSGSCHRAKAAAFRSTAELRTNGLNVSHSEHKIGAQVPLDGGEYGGCTCRQVRYRLIGAPLIVHAYHCRWCQ